MKLPRQIIFKRLGGIKNLFTRTAFYISLVNFLMLATTTYVIVVKEYFQLPFWMFMFGIICLVLIAMIFEYTIMLPSEIAFGNWQVYTHDNPIRRDLEEIKKDLEYLKKKEK